MISASKLTDITLYTELRFEDEVIEIRYRLGALSAENEAKRITQRYHNGSLYDLLADACTSIGISVPDGNGGEKPIDCTPDGLREAVAQHGVPPALLRAIWRQIESDAQVGKLNGSPSSALWR